MFELFLAITHDGVTKGKVAQLFQAIDSCSDPTALHQLLDDLLAFGLGEDSDVVQLVRQRLGALKRLESLKPDVVQERIEALEIARNQRRTTSESERDTGPSI